jgi:hypothetical protein
MPASTNPSPSANTATVKVLSSGSLYFLSFFKDTLLPSFNKMVESELLIK